ncbi:50S ribosomal protein L25/general stress protein Ctc [Roseovarius atlanticus]|uniref:50S ribosomal protein L25/general stress protein Ctc n=1 Tax=Roseovarius atlanticus TaxID=1641875 RepID=UPI001C97D79C|nr:50S ribosomal protein L25/general stress protein Ctc [Roseovarius atlanticus]MBY5986342.1 50S ribosomal protein L25/general stress protein Ctc [Roseovarius atlanticus]MBY6124982.1 50S ribosomal protein L25/general stress protein Ctc [Roseovarius atlanticus]MBY6150557.1 50S ribosomal protein L25/general stress protein Ctc [Roseovarius atlanticus]
MAGEIPDLHAQERTGTGKGAARAARRDGMVPGIVFGGDVDPLPVNIPFNVLLKRLKQGRFKSTLFNLKVDGHDDVRVICRDVQRDVVKDLPTHFDLMRLRRTTKINLFIPVEFINEEECEALKTGVLTVIRNEIELVVTAGDIPESITVDLSLMENIGDTITISQVTLPEGAKPTIDRDFVICNIAAPSALKSDADDEDEDVAADEVPATEQEAGPDSVEEAEGGED